MANETVTSGWLDTAATGAGMVPAFQPIVALPEEATVGFEALARWPERPSCEPEQVFNHAAATGTLETLDRLCSDAAISIGLDAHLRRGTLLCVNAEPSTAYPGREGDPMFARAHDELTLMFEITERNLLAHPHSLIRKVAALRADGFAIALDDVGAHPDSLALLDVIRPDVIKLDLALVQTQPTYAQARTLAAVLAHHERTGAAILAEGIETEEHLEQALAVGATLGQGFRFGHAGPLDRDATALWLPPPLTKPQDASTGSPFDRVAGTSPVRTARKKTLTALSRNIESQAAQADDRPMVFTALQRDQHFTGATRDRYRDLATTCPLVAVFGQNLPTELGSGVRGIELDPADPLCAEWTVIALGPHNATALIAREQTHQSAQAIRDGDRRFDFVITYDRTLVTAAARDLLDRMQ
jgi:EAL domain-containing protein (putative c-di-GMP-specific phosphodiesterase class I)